MSNTQETELEKKKRLKKVATATIVGSMLEWYDFYLYATMASIVFAKVFFDTSDPGSASLKAFATFAIGFIARPLGGLFFGYFGDKYGRKKVLFVTFLLMGLCTTAIGLIPTYESIGIWAAVLLVTFRIIQGLGAGAEFAGAAITSYEHASEDKRGSQGAWPALGLNLGLLLSSLTVFLLTLNGDEFLINGGWRIPFIASAVLVIVGLWIRLKLHETPAFQKVLDKQKEVNVPFKEVMTKHLPMLVLGTIAAICTFVVFYLTTVFALNWGTTQLGYSRAEFLKLQLIATLCFAAFIPLSAVLAEKFGRKTTSIAVCVLSALFGLVFSSMLESGNTFVVFLFLCIGLSIMGLTYGPIGTVLSEIFPISVRYTGSALTFNLAGIFGASFAPLIATKLATTYGLHAVGYYLTAASLLSLCAFLMIRETKNDDVNNQI